MAKKGPCPDDEKREYWQAAIELWRESGLTIRAFCRQEELTESAFHFWKRQLLQEQKPAAKEKETTGAPNGQSRPHFVPVEIDAGGRSPLVIELASGATVRVADGCSRALVQTVLEALRC